MQKIRRGFFKHVGAKRPRKIQAMLTSGASTARALAINTPVWIWELEAYSQYYCLLTTVSKVEVLIKFNSGLLSESSLASQLTRCLHRLHLVPRSCTLHVNASEVCLTIITRMMKC